MFQKATLVIIEEYIEEIYDNGILLSNYFNLDLNDVEFCKTEFSIVLKKQSTNFCRIYFLTSNIDDLKDLLFKIDGVQVINFPTVQDIKEFNQLMIDSGFNLFRTYEIYSNNQIRGNDIFVNQFANESNFSRVKFLLYTELNEYTDHLPNDICLMSMISNNQVLVNYENGEICGIFIFSIDGKKCYFNFWVDKGKNGLFLIYNMYNYLKLKNIPYSYLWVNTNNEKVKKIHKLFGSHPNGTRDYIYMKNLILEQ